MNVDALYKFFSAHVPNGNDESRVNEGVRIEIYTSGQDVLLVPPGSEFKFLKSKETITIMFGSDVYWIDTQAISKIKVVPIDGTSASDPQVW